MKAGVRSIFKVKMDQVEIRLAYRALNYCVANDQIMDGESKRAMQDLSIEFQKALHLVGEKTT